VYSDVPPLWMGALNEFYGKRVSVHNSAPACRADPHRRVRSVWQLITCFSLRIASPIPHIHRTHAAPTCGRKNLQSERAFLFETSIQYFSYALSYTQCPVSLLPSLLPTPFTFSLTRCGMRRKKISLLFFFFIRSERKMRDDARVYSSSYCMLLNSFLSLSSAAVGMLFFFGSSTMYMNISMPECT
jgi:hypothetical protein